MAVGAQRRHALRVADQLQLSEECSRVARTRAVCHIHDERVDENVHDGPTGGVATYRRKNRHGHRGAKDVNEDREQRSDEHEETEALVGTELHLLRGEGGAHLREAGAL